MRGGKKLAKFGVGSQTDPETFSARSDTTFGLGSDTQGGVDIEIGVTNGSGQCLLGQTPSLTCLA